MLIYLLRHGLTQDNQEKRYQGRRDVPLCPQGLAQLRRADFAPKTVMITSLQRTRQTAGGLLKSKGKQCKRPDAGLHTRRCSALP